MVYSLLDVLINFNNIAGVAKQNPEQFLQSDPTVKAKEDAESEMKSITAVTAVTLVSGSQGQPFVSAFETSRKRHDKAEHSPVAENAALRKKYELPKQKHH